MHETPSNARVGLGVFASDKNQTIVAHKKPKETAL
jgi:hypothetical protein